MAMGAKTRPILLFTMGSSNFFVEQQECGTSWRVLGQETIPEVQETFCN